MAIKTQIFNINIIQYKLNKLIFLLWHDYLSFHMSWLYTINITSIKKLRY